MDLPPHAPRLWQRAWPWAVVALLVLVATGLRWQVLASSPWPLGVDGFFYPTQVRALLETGELRYPASPLTFWLMAPIASISDPITAAKLVAAFGTAALALPMFGLVRQLTGHTSAALIAAAVAVSAPSHQYLAYEFVKQGLGLTFATVAIWAGVVALTTLRPRALILAVVALTATALTHKLALGLALLVLVPCGLGALFAVRSPRSKALGKRALALGLFALAAGVIALGAVAPARFLALRDGALVPALVDDHARWSAPALAIGGSELRMGYDALAAGLLGLAGWLGWMTRRRWADPGPWHDLPRSHPRAVAVLALAAFAVAVALPWLAVGDPQGLGFRLRISASLPLAVLAGVGVALSAPRLARLLPSLPSAVPVVAPLAICVALLFGRGQPDARAVLRPHPALVAATARIPTDLPADAVIIVPERRILFMAAWFSNAPVALRPEPVPAARRWRLLPMAYTGRDSPMGQALDLARTTPGVTAPLSLHEGHRNGLVLVPEATWDWLLTQLPETLRRRFAAWRTI